jgi:Domain of unknown function (DUF5666)
MKLSIRDIFAALLTTALLAACNSDDNNGSSGNANSANSTNTAASATERQTVGTAAPAVNATQGTVSGFGSVVVDGTTLDDSAATVEIAGATEDMRRIGSLADVRLGQRVHVAHDAAGRATGIRVEPELIGAVAGVNATSSSFTVNGVTIKVNSDATNGPVTVLSGYASLSELKVGDRVEVHGFAVVDASAQIAIQATRVEPAPAGTTILVTGTVSGATASGFSLGTLAVTTNGTTKIAPTGATIADGLSVTVTSTGIATATGITAAVVKVRRAADTTAALRVAGFVTGYQAASKSFTLAGMRVDAATATLAPAGATLGDNRYVVALGTYTAATNTLVATQILVTRRDDVADVRLHGTITDFVDATNFKVRGALVDASAATITGGTIADLVDNVFVEVRGTIANNKVAAVSVTVRTASPQGKHHAHWGGLVTAYDTATRVLRATGKNGQAFTATLAADARITPTGKTVADLIVGRYVRLTGMSENGAFVATHVAITGAAANPLTRELEGIVSNVDPSTGAPTSFRLNGLTIAIATGVAVPAGFANGARVEVSVTKVDGAWTAQSIEIDS